MSTSKKAFLLFLGVLAIIGLAIVAISPLIALGSNQIIFTVAPTLEAVRISAFGN